MITMTLLIMFTLTCIAIYTPGAMCGRAPMCEVALYHTFHQTYAAFWLYFHFICEIEKVVSIVLGIIAIMMITCHYVIRLSKKGKKGLC